MTGEISQRRLLRHSMSAGALAGVVIGGAEAVALNLFDAEIADRTTLWWTPLFYAALFAPFGAVCGLVCHTTLRFFGKQRNEELAHRFAFGTLIFVGTLTTLRWRLHADLSWLAAEYGRSLIDLSIAGAAFAVAALAGWAIGARPTRRQWLCAAVFVSMSALGTGIPVHNARRLAQSEVLPSTGPNIILIAIDTLRADYLKLYDPRAPTKTASIDRFAQDAVLFRNGIAQGTWTKAGFGAIYAGLRPREHTAIDTQHRLPDEIETLAEVLRAAGYSTLGMSNSNPNIAMKMNFDQGFGYYRDLRERGFSVGIPISGRRLALVRRFVKPVVDRLWPFHVNIDQYYRRANHVTKIGLDWVDRRTSRDRPFFLTVHFMDPHDPYMNGQRKGRGYAHHRLMSHAREQLLDEFVEAYVGDINYMDPHIGAFLDGLRERGLYDDALIILTSDHGEEFFEHGDFSHGQSVYEELLRIPLIVKLPGNQAAGMTNSYLARQIDVAPTILALGEVAIPIAMRGRPLLSGDGIFLNADIEGVISESNLAGRELASIQTATQKFIRDGSYGGEITTREFYDLERDPGESVDLAQSNDRSIDELAKLLDDFLIGDADRPAAETTELSPGVVEQLKALGYGD